MLFVALAEVSERVAATSKRTDKRELLAATLRTLTPAEVVVAVGVLTGEPRQGRIGVGWRSLSRVEGDPASTPSLEILEVDRWLDQLAATTGAGSVAARQQLLRSVFDRATASEQRLLWGVLGGELRQGALDGVMIEAIAAGAAVPADAVRRAHMLSGELAATAWPGVRRRGRRTGAGRPSPGSGGRPDARVAGRRRRRCAARDRRGVGGVEARRRPAAGAPP